MEDKLNAKVNPNKPTLEDLKAEPTKKALNVPERKFKSEDKVKEKTNPSEKLGEMLGFEYDREKGYTYRFRSLDFDTANKVVVEGVKTLHESELEL